MWLLSFPHHSCQKRPSKSLVFDSWFERLFQHLWCGKHNTHISSSQYSLNALCINQPTNPRTNPWNFHNKILRIGDFEKCTFFKSAILNFFFEFFFFCFIPMKISPNLYGRMDGSKFWCFPWFPENSLLCVILRYTVQCR